MGGSTRLRYQPQDGQEMLLLINSGIRCAASNSFISARSEASLKLS